jgi:hypothetical protein
VGPRLLSSFISFWFFPRLLLFIWARVFNVAPVHHDFVIAKPDPWNFPFPTARADSGFSASFYLGVSSTSPGSGKDEFSRCRR